MTNKLTMILAMVLASGLSSLRAADSQPPASPAADDEVIMRGMIQPANRRHFCVPKEEWDKDPYGKDTTIFFALDGNPNTAAEFVKIVDECIPENAVEVGLDANHAEAMKKQIDARALYYVDAPPDVFTFIIKIPSIPLGTHVLKGKVEIRDGKKWIVIPDTNHVDCVKLPGFKYPPKYQKLGIPTAPFLSAGEPLTIKINDKIEVKFINAPPGRFMKGKPYWMPGYPEEQPSFVTLTKPFYMSETVVDQELYEAIMGEPVNNPKVKPEMFADLSEKNPKLPVLGVDNPHREKFFKLFSEKAGRHARLPTAAEWEYATRCGSCTPPWYYFDYLKDYNSNDPTRKGYWHLTLPVKSKKPNAWGLYDFFTPLWEIVGDAEPLAGSMDIVDMVDPFHPQPAGLPIEKWVHFAYGKFGLSTTSIGEVPEDERHVGRYAELFRIVLEQDAKNNLKP